MSERDEDALWRSIVDNYGERVTLDPAEPPRGDEPAAPSYDEGRVAGPGGHEPDVLDAWDDPDDHFVPPEPPPLPQPEPPRLIAWAGVLGVPLLTIVLTVVHWTVPGFLSLLALAWFVGGFGYLVATMRRGTDLDEWDDGAVL